MIQLKSRVDVLIQFGNTIRSLIEDVQTGRNQEAIGIFAKASQENPWFTKNNILFALQNWSIALTPDKVRKWLEPYLSQLEKNGKERRVAVINAGNIPFVGLHDLLAVLTSGCTYIGKNASDDNLLLRYLAGILCSIEPEFCERISFVSRIENIDLVIATGNNNSARYFEYYFSKYPNIIRKNRNGVGVLNGKETREQLHALGQDIFSYFGLGCRNVSKLFVPAGYDFRNFFESIEDFNEIAQHTKYMNNFEYNNSVLLLKRINFLQNGFLIVRKENQIASPVSILHFEEYNNRNDLNRILSDNFSSLQCIVSSEKFSAKELERIRIDFGKTQTPELWEYADGVDTVKFILSN